MCYRTLTSCVRERLTTANDGSDCRISEVTSLQDECKAVCQMRQVYFFCVYAKYEDEAAATDDVSDTLCQLEELQQQQSVYTALDW